MCPLSHKYRTLTSVQHVLIYKLIIQIKKFYMQRKIFRLYIYINLYSRILYFGVDYYPCRISIGTWY